MVVFMVDMVCDKCNNIYKYGGYFFVGIVDGDLDCKYGD